MKTTNKTLDSKNCTLKDLIRFIESTGYTFERQNGSHMIYKNRKTGISLSIPNKPLSDGTRRNLVKQILGESYYSKNLQYA